MSKEHPLVIDFGSTMNNKHDSIKSKVTKAKEYGNQEIDILNSAMKNFQKDTEDLVLVKEFTKEMGTLFDLYMNDLIIPVIKGNLPPNVDEQQFNQLRSEKFKLLIAKYIDKELNI